MNIEHRIQNNTLVFTFLDTRLDAKNSTECKQEISRLIYLNKIYQVVFDLRTLEFVDSSAITVFLSTLRLVNSHGGELKLADATKPVRTILELVSMHKIFEIYKTADEAVNSFKQTVESPFNNKK
jgi:anti-anti-sigma factor